MIKHGDLEHGDMEQRRLDDAVTHDSMGVSFYTAGSATIEFDSQWSVRAGDVVLVPAGSPHRMMGMEKVEGWGLGFCPVCFVADGDASLLEPFDRVRSGASTVVTIAENRRAFFESLFRELHQELEKPRDGTRIIQRSLISLILSEVSSAASRGEQTLAVDDVVSNALRFIERRCLEGISLRDVAAGVHRSPAHLTTAVRRATGRSVQEWIIAGRMSEARRRLLHSDELVDVIADRVGYADATHFIRIFRRIHGATPAAWRANHRHMATPQAR
ncbi:AraC family transcriptional regulator [Hyalangium versicolor]|uniref:AraC family transcriptional regulator n=1 Tax=Hyalangium versicolor TaxID=2861190 RepID=UPI001CCC9865|nr:AraC family transcriptional regulator [Hyalangium versicolor]